MPSTQPAETNVGSRWWASGRRLFRLAALLVLAVALFGQVGRAYLIETGQGLVRREFPLNIFFRLYAQHEQPLLILLALFASLAWWTAGQEWRYGSRPLQRLEELSVRITLGRLVAAVLAAASIGTLTVMHMIGLSMDEFGASFQARIFSAGRITAPIPAEWQPLAFWMTPIFVTYKAGAQLWISTYLPAYAALRSLFVPLSSEWLLNPLLAAGSVLLLDRVARRMWPDAARRRLLALAFLITSAQFLATSMSGYAMPAHLFFNLLWLLLYLREDRTGYLLMPWVGSLALGLHNPFPHALFVAPFLIRMLRRRQFTWLTYGAVVYVAAAMLWLRWLGFAHATGGGGPGVGPPGPGSQMPSVTGLLGAFQLPQSNMVFVHGLDLTLLFSWQTPVVSVLLLFAMLSWRRLGRTERDLAWGLLLTFAFYLLFPVNQGHGWGYRYVYGALGNVALIAAVGGALAMEQLGRERVRALVMASLLATVAMQLPLRFWQIERFVRPYADAIAFIAARPAPLVAIDYAEGAYAWDLIRNDPLFREGPRITAFSPRGAPPPAAVPPSVRDSVYIFSRREMELFGIPVWPRP